MRSTLNKKQEYPYLCLLLLISVDKDDQAELLLVYISKVSYVRRFASEKSTLRLQLYYWFSELPRTS